VHYLGVYCNAGSFTILSVHEANVCWDIPLTAAILKTTTK